MPRFRRASRYRSHRERPSPHRLFSRRLLALTSFFVVVCLVYGAILIGLQAKGNAYSIYVPSTKAPDGGAVQTVTLQAARGEIYDRNGRPLVTNHYSYALTLDHASFTASGPIDSRNAALLSIDRAVQKAGLVTVAASRSPFEGVYPKMSYAEALSFKDSAEQRSLARVLDTISLKSDASAEALCAYFVDTYALDASIDGIPQYTADEITALITIYYDMVLEKFSAVTPYTLAGDVPAELISHLKETGTPGVLFTVKAQRVYHYPGYAAHLLGRVGQIFAEDWAYYSAMGYPMNAVVGVSGAESAFESILHGTDGKMEVVLDRNGGVVSRNVITPAIAGQDIYLTIDIDAQIAAEDALRAAIERSPTATAGSVVAMAADSGEYLVLASLPTFDASTFSADFESLRDDERLPLLNRAVSATYTPSSLMHLVTATAGLAEGRISASTLWQDDTSLTMQDHTLSCSRYTQTGSHHGALGVSTALRDGCDVFFGQLGLALGGSALEKWEIRLGLGQKTGIELGESAGSASRVVPATEAMVMRAAVGQSAAAMTPAQMASMLSAFLGRGERYEGHLLSEVRDFTSGEVVYRKPSTLLASSDIAEEHVQLLLRSMKNTALFSNSLIHATETLHRQGMTVGALEATSPAGTVSEDHALLLMFGSPSESASYGSVSVAVTIENAGTATSTHAVGAAALEALLCP